MAADPSADKAVRFGTVSSPVSRQTSRHDITSSNGDSPPSSGRTAFDDNDQPITAIDHATGYVGGMAPRLSVSAPMSPPLFKTDTLDQLTQSSAGAPASNPAPVFLAPINTGGDTLVQTRSHDDVQPRAMPKSAGYNTTTFRPSARRTHSGYSSHRNHSFDPYGYPYPSPLPWDRRPVDHQSAKHRTPLFSLARPLPTNEQRLAQKAYRDDVRARAAAHSAVGGHNGTIDDGASYHSHHRHSHHHSSSATPRRYPRQDLRIGPGAMHHGGVAGPASAYYTPHTATSAYFPSHNRDFRIGGDGGGDKDQIMDLLKQLLRENEKTNKKVDEFAVANAEDVRDDGEGGAGKEGKMDKNESGAEKRTARAERRDSLTSSGSGSSCDSEDDDAEEFPNPWARFRHTMREVFAEFLGTFLLIMFGTGVSLQYFLSTSKAVTDTTYGTYLSVSFGWGIGVAMGVWVAGGISGGHINPAVTLSLAVFRGFPWRKVPGYVLAQIAGSTCAAGLNYGLYRRAISLYEGGPGIRTVTGATATANLFATYPQTYLSDANAFFQEFVNATILLVVVLAISDSNNASPPDGLNPLVLFLLITGLGAALGMQTAYCINPARDLGPRLVTWWAGYGREVWNFRNQYWLWTPVCATIAGALFGSFLYDAMLYTGSESPLNRKWTWPWSNKRREAFAPASKHKMPAGQSEA